MVSILDWLKELTLSLIMKIMPSKLEIRTRAQKSRVKKFEPSESGEQTRLQPWAVVVLKKSPSFLARRIFF